MLLIIGVRNIVGRVSRALAVGEDFSDVNGLPETGEEFVTTKLINTLRAFHSGHKVVILFHEVWFCLSRMCGCNGLL